MRTGYGYSVESREEKLPSAGPAKFPAAFAGVLSFFSFIFAAVSLGYARDDKVNPQDARTAYAGASIPVDLVIMFYCFIRCLLFKKRSSVALALISFLDLLLVGGGAAFGAFKVKYYLDNGSCEAMIDHSKLDKRAVIITKPDTPCSFWKAMFGLELASSAFMIMAIFYYHVRMCAFRRKN